MPWTQRAYAYFDCLSESKHASDERQGKEEWDIEFKRCVFATVRLAKTIISKNLVLSAINNKRLENDNINTENYISFTSTHTPHQHANKTTPTIAMCYFRRTHNTRHALTHIHHTAPNATKTKMLATRYFIRRFVCLWMKIQSVHMFKINILLVSVCVFVYTVLAALNTHTQSILAWVTQWNENFHTIEHFSPVYLSSFFSRS